MQNVSSDFIKALKADRQTVLTKVNILEGQYRYPIATLTDIDDGSVSVDTSRGTRRTCQLRLPNEGGTHTPTSLTSNFSYSTLIQPYRGLRFVSSVSGKVVDEYVLLGTFMVDKPEVFVERGMSVITVDGSDLWKKIAIGGFASPCAFTSGTHINTVITQVATDAGIPSNWLTLNALSDRATTEKTLTNTVQWELGDNRSDFLTSFAAQWGINLFFSPAGYLYSEEVTDPSAEEPVWTFQKGIDATMLGLTYLTTDTALMNHVIVTGESASSGTVEKLYEIYDNDPNSASYVGRIGHRTYVYSGPQITTAVQAELAGIKLYREKCLIDETIKLPTLIIPQLEGGDVIRVIEPDFTFLDQKYLCTRFDISLRDSRMVIDTKRAKPMPT
jgi:hypothetical protein